MVFTIVSMGFRTSEECMWVVEGRRHICISYYYNSKSGELYYAATIFKAHDLNYKMTQEEIDNHEHTTTQRYIIRPAFVYTHKNMNYEYLIKNIRYQMIHGPGCKGPRNKYKFDYDELSEDSFLSNSSSIVSGNSGNIENIENSPPKYYIDTNYYVADHIFNLKTIKYFMYYVISNEKFQGCNKTIREFMVAYKGSKSNGDLIYGASISRRGYDENENDNYLTEEEVKSHYNTAENRLLKCPVQMNIPDEYRHQLVHTSQHDEDVMYCIMDRIYNRIGGYFQIRGLRL